MNHLAVTSILTVVAHIIWFASMTERKYPIKKTVLLYGLYAIFFTVWAILAYSLLGKDSPYVIPFSFVGTILPAILLFLYTSSDSFSKHQMRMGTQNHIHPTLQHQIPNFLLGFAHRAVVLAAPMEQGNDNIWLF